MSATKAVPGTRATTTPPRVPDASVIDAQAVRGVLVGLLLSAVLWLVIALVVIVVW